MATGKITRKEVNDAVHGGPFRFPWGEELRGYGLNITPTGRSGAIFRHLPGDRETKTKL